MNTEIYSKRLVDRYENENMFFKDEKLKKYFNRNEQRDLRKFRERVHAKYPDKSFEKMMYLFVTNSIRDIIIETIAELSNYMKDSGDMIISGGEAFNLYMDFENRIITPDIDAKFIPRMHLNQKFFGKLQATKLLLWDKLGKTAKLLNARIKKRILNMKTKHSKLFKFLGIGFTTNGPFVTRRYTLIKKKKIGNTANPTKGDIFIDVELFALDLNIRFFSPRTGKIETQTLGGILDIPFMRPKEFGYEVVLNRRKGITYINIETGKLVTRNDVYVASKEFLIEDIYLMSKLNLRPDKKQKDRLRLIKLGQLFDKNIKNSDSIDDVFKGIESIIKKRNKPVVKRGGKVSIKKASQINPYKYGKFTSKPIPERLSKQIVYGVKTSRKDINIQNYEKSSGNKRFNLKTLKWENVTNNTYIKNEFNLRPINVKKIPKNINAVKTLYGFKPKRNAWVPNKVLNKSAEIPFVGLKN